MTNSEISQPKTFSELTAQRNESLKNVRESSARIKSMTRSLFDPPKSDTRLGTIMNNFDKVLALYDGVLLGVKVIGRMRRAFRRK